MTSLPVLRNLTSIALTACCAIGLASARAQTYNLTDLGVLPDQKDGNSVPAAINYDAQVAGTSGTSAFRYTKSRKVPLENVGDVPAASISRGFGINSSGQVVGDSTFGKKPTSHAAIFRNGTATDLGTLEEVTARFSRANGINASGQVVGFAGNTLDGNESRAFIVSAFTPGNIPNRMVDLGTLGGAYAQALGINDSGFVTGNSQTTTDKVGPTHAFIAHLSKPMIDLGTLDGDFSYGTAINGNNHVVGYSTINNTDNRLHAFLYNGKTMVDLGSLSGAFLAGDNSYALGVNANDQVVGYTYLPSDGPWPVAFVYRNGLMLDLNDLIGNAAKDYRLDSATAINDKGQIVAVAFVKAASAFHAVLLSPEGPTPMP